MDMLLLAILATICESAFEKPFLAAMPRVQLSCIVRVFCVQTKLIGPPSASETTKPLVSAWAPLQLTLFLAMVISAFPFIKKEIPTFEESSAPAIVQLLTRTLPKFGLFPTTISSASKGGIDGILSNFCIGDRYASHSSAQVNGAIGNYGGVP